MKKFLHFLKSVYLLIIQKSLKAIFFLLLIFGLNANAQEGSKLAPAFRYLLSNPITEDNREAYPALYKNAVLEGYNKKTGKTEKGYSCIIYTEFPEVLESRGINVQSKLPRFVTAWVSTEELMELSRMQEVIYIDAPTIVYPNNDVSTGGSGASLLHAGKLRNTVYKGTGVIVGVFDSGIDWDHPDFRQIANQTQSRILRIWDQTISPIGAETNPSGFGYGVEYTQAHINNEIDGSPAGFVRQVDINGHGTHVTGTAAGNGAAASSGKYAGMAPDADIVVVKGGNGSFSSTNVIDALTYFRNVATSLGKPIVVNMSIGGQMSAHDGTDAQEVAIDNFIASGPGRVVVVAAGNDHGSAIHRQLSIPGSGSGSVSLSVPAPSGSTSLDVLQMTLYANDASAVNCTITAPGGTTAIANAGQSVSINVMGGSATAHLMNVIDAGSGDRMINVYIVRSTTSFNPAGTWTIALNNATASSLTVHGWLNYKGPNFGNITLTSGDNNNLVGSPGCATNAITVGSFMARMDWQSTAGATLAYGGTQDDISTFSSRGPRRDNVEKPDISANGQGVASCLSSNAGIPNTDNSVVVNNFYNINQGTSMASPEVAGAVALMLQIRNNATSADIKSAIEGNAIKDAFTTNVSNSTWGNGKLDIYRSASTFAYCAAQNRVILSYDSSTSSAGNFGVNLGAFRAAMRFTPTITGQLGGVMFETWTGLSLTSFTVEVRTNTAGAPGALLGSLAIPVGNIAQFSWNHFDLTSLNIAVTSGTDYFIVLVPGAGSTFIMAYESISTSGRAFYNNGAWTGFNDFRIRSIIYNNGGTASASIVLTSAAGTNAQSKCANTAITNITYATTGATGATFSGLPAGVTGSWAANVATIQGTPTVAGTFNYTVTLTGVPCGSSSANGTLTISAPPTANAGGPNSVCQSASPSPITLSGATIGGSATTGAWSIISGGGSLSNNSQTATPATVTYTPAANFSGTVILRLTTNAGSGCNAAQSDRTINVNAIPTSTAGGPNSVCQSASPSPITLSGASVGGSATTGAWSILSGGGTLSSTAQTATPATVTYTPAANFNGTVTLRLTSNFGTGCVAATSDRTITVSATPTANAGGPNSVCQSASPTAITLSGASVGGSATTGAWSIISGGGTLSSTAQTASPATVTYTRVANFSGTVTLRLTSNAVSGCVAATSDRTITVNAIPTATAGNTINACPSASPSPITLSGASVGGSATTGAWSIISGGGTLSSTSQTATPATVTYTPVANFSGTVTLRLTSNFGTGCVAATSDRTINIAGPTATAGGPNSVCQSASPSPITLTGASFGGNAVSAAWSVLSGGGTLSSTAQTATPSTVTYTPAANSSGTIILRLTTNTPAGCVAATSDRTITVNATPQAFAGGPNTICQAASPSPFPLAGSGLGGSATTGAWSIISGGGTLSSTAQTATPSSVTYTVAANFVGTITLRLTTNAGTGCVAATADRTINVNPAPFATAGGPNTVCQSASPSPITLSGASVSGGASTGAWSIISGGGTLSSVSQTGTPATVTYTPAANFSGTVTLRLTSNFSSGCSAATSDRTITVNAIPTATAGGPNSVCQSASPSPITLSGASVGGSATTGAWSIIGGGGTLSSTSQTATPATVTYTPAANFSGTVTLRLTSNFGTGCAAATSDRTITVNAIPTATAGGPNSVCRSASPSPITLSGASVGGSATTGAWSIISGGGTLSSTAQTATPATVTYTPAANFNGTVTLRLTSNFGTGCVAATSDRTITVNAIPTATAGGPNSVCRSASPSQITLSGASVGGSATTGAWSIISGGGTLSSTAQTATPATVTYTPAANFNGTVTLRLTSNFGTGCVAATSDRTITVNAIPTANAGGPNNICQSASPSPITLSGSSVGGSATTGSWSVISGGGTLSSTSQTANPSAVTYTPVANFTGTVTLRLTSNFGTGCVAATSDRTINVNAKPVPSITGTLTICPGGSTILNAGAGFSLYQWSTGANTQTISVNSAATYTVTVTNANGCTGTTSATVTMSGSCGATLNLKAFIEGYYTGSSTQSQVLMNSGVGSNPVHSDSITVELKDQFSGLTVATQKVILQTNGTAQAIFANGISGGTFYIVIKGRNLVETWSKIPVTFGSVTNFDFSD